MALVLAKATNYGVDAAYWKVAVTNINWHSRAAHVDLLGFVSEDARRTEKNPIAVCSYDWSGEGFPFDLERNIVADTYAQVKTLEEWAGAEDA